jgi:hypothetical protein
VWKPLKRRIRLTSQFRGPYPKILRMPPGEKTNPEFENCKKSKKKKSFNENKKLLFTLMFQNYFAFL